MNPNLKKKQKKNKKTEKHCKEVLYEYIVQTKTNIDGSALQ